MAPEMLTLLLVGIAAMIAMTIWMAWLRTSSLQLSEELENQTGAAFE